MDTLFENIRLYCDILKKCSLPVVKNWQTEDLDRAIHWADYFNKALVRIAKRRSVVAKVDEKLKEIGRQGNGWRLGGKELNFDSFKKSSEYLIEALFDNPHLPPRLRERIINRLEETTTPIALEPPRKVKCEGILSGGTASGSLNEGSSVGQATKDAVGIRSPPHPLAVPTDALSLLESIEQICGQKMKTKSKSNDGNSLVAVCERLDLLSNMEGAMKVILQALVEPPSKHGRAQEAVLHWLLEKVKRANNKDQPADYIWQQPAELLAKISSLYLEFFKEHIQYLSKEVEKLETITVEEPRMLTCKGGTTKMGISELVTNFNLKSCSTSLEGITTHFVQLSKTSSEVKGVCLSLLKNRALKHSTSGRFSYSSPLTTCVWTRLLTTISERTQ